MRNTIENAAVGLDTYVRSWKPAIGIDITGESSFLETVDAILPAFDKEIENKQAATETAITYFVASKFLCYKTIYRFESGFIEVLSKTEDSPIYQSSLKNLPVKCFIVALENKSYMGLIISVEMVEQVTRLSAIGIPHGDISKANSVTFTLNIQDGETISSAMSAWHREYDEISPKNEVADSETIQILALATQIAYYLSAKNCAIRKISIPKAKRPRRNNGTPLNLQEWNVGYRIGNIFDPEKNETVPSTISTGTGTAGSSPRPHVRRAHFHHYWVGPGRSKCIVKWIEPVWVNGNSDTIIPTEHSVIAK